MGTNDCKATLEIADDYGDNHATMHCQLTSTHEGNHKEGYKIFINGKDKKVTVEWE